VTLNAAAYNALCDTILAERERAVRAEADAEALRDCAKDLKEAAELVLADAGITVTWPPSVAVLASSSPGASLLTDLLRELDEAREHQIGGDTAALLAQLTQERDEARAWAERTVAEVVAARIVTCVYCGHEYPSGTPASQDAALTAHIVECPKHPMSALHAKLAASGAALGEAVTRAAEERRQDLQTLDSIHEQRDHWQARWEQAESKLAASEADRARLREALTMYRGACQMIGVLDGLQDMQRAYDMAEAALAASGPSPEREQLIALLGAGRKYSQMWHQANVGSALNPIRDELFAALHALDGVES
jgi:hypothetical protein